MSIRFQTKTTNLMVGAALIIIGCFGFVLPIVLPIGCGPGSLIVQGACNELGKTELFTGWLLGASSFGLAAVILLAGRAKMGLHQILEVATLAYGVLPLVLFLTMVFTNLPGSTYMVQIMIAYYLPTLFAGLVTIFGRAGAIGKPSAPS